MSNPGLVDYAELRFSRREYFSSIRKCMHDLGAYRTRKKIKSKRKTVPDNISDGYEFFSALADLLVTEVQSVQF